MYGAIVFKQKTSANETRTSFLITGGGEGIIHAQLRMHKWREMFLNENTSSRYRPLIIKYYSYFWSFYLKILLYIYVIKY